MTTISLLWWLPGCTLRHGEPRPCHASMHLPRCGIWLLGCGLGFPLMPALLMNMCLPMSAHAKILLRRCASSFKTCARILACAPSHILNVDLLAAPSAFLSNIKPSEEDDAHWLLDFYRSFR